MSTVLNKADILENDLREKYPAVLDLLLKDQTTKKNIFWATNDYQHLGSGYEYGSPINPKLITNGNGHVIMPRAEKAKSLQQTRARGMAEVFTPSWVCNAQNNLIDNHWFGTDNIFNTVVTNERGECSWSTSTNKIPFSKDKTWKDYIRKIHLEVACGEAPYVTSRYDATTGHFIPVKHRIGMLDRKLRVINENTTIIKDWVKATQEAFQSTYAYEWQGDSLLLARESILFTFIENYLEKFGKTPGLNSLKEIAEIISWNIWQMDGLTGTVPDSCNERKQTSINLFGETETKDSICVGCKDSNLKKHNGTYCNIRDWKESKEMRFIDLVDRINV